jgi:1-acyl-sn-glycerol-3-phosphate acyltransferase
MAGKNSDPRKYLSRWRRIFRYPAQQIALKFALRRVLQITVSGRDNLRKVAQMNTKFIIVANHSSHFDAPLVLTNLPWTFAKQTATAAANEYFFAKFFPRKMTRLFFNTFPVDRKGENAHSGLAEKLLARGSGLLIFPEGTRSRDGNLGDFHAGAARLAIEYDAVVLPVSLRGAFAAWPATAKRWRAGRPPVRVNFLTPIRPRERETATQLTSRIKTTIAKDLRGTENSCKLKA